MERANSPVKQLTQHVIHGLAVLLHRGRRVLGGRRRRRGLLRRSRLRIGRRSRDAAAIAVASSGGSAAGPTGAAAGIAQSAEQSAKRLAKTTVKPATEQVAG